MTGEPNLLIGCRAISPSATGPQWQATIAASLVPEPSGAWTNVAATEMLVGDRRGEVPIKSQHLAGALSNE